MGRRVEQFCIWGHDTFVVGRDKHWECKECRRARDRRRNPKRRALEAARGNRVSKKVDVDRPDWERARVERWLEIVADNPLDINLKSTQLRGREFQVRYDRLEAEVPMP